MADQHIPIKPLIGLIKRKPLPVKQVEAPDASFNVDFAKGITSSSWRTAFTGTLSRLRAMATIRWSIGRTLPFGNLVPTYLEGLVIDAPKRTRYTPFGKMAEETWLDRMLCDVLGTNYATLLVKEYVDVLTPQFLSMVQVVSQSLKSFNYLFHRGLLPHDIGTFAKEPLVDLIKDICLLDLRLHSHRYVVESYGCPISRYQVADSHEFNFSPDRYDAIRELIPNAVLTDGYRYLRQSIETSYLPPHLTLKARYKAAYCCIGHGTVAIYARLLSRLNEDVSELVDLYFKTLSPPTRDEDGECRDGASGSKHERNEEAMDPLIEGPFGSLWLQVESIEPPLGPVTRNPLALSLASWTSGHLRAPLRAGLDMKILVRPQPDRFVVNVLIDGSGSMRWDLNDLETLVQLVPWANAYLYYGPESGGPVKRPYEKGKFIVLAENGKCVQSLPKHILPEGMQNWCDYAAYQAMQARSPRANLVVLVSDGGTFCFASKSRTVSRVGLGQRTMDSIFPLWITGDVVPTGARPHVRVGNAIALRHLLLAKRCIAPTTSIQGA